MHPSVSRLAIQFLAGLLFLLLLAGVYGLYSLGFGGIFSFDDASGLEGLLTIKDWSTAIVYLTTGGNGPLGRPIALASFLIDAPGYPESASGFLYTNSLIHLLNICLVALVVLRLQRLLPDILPTSPWFAPITATFWGLLPILASTSMMVLQRMTSLSALFVLLGIWIYLLGRAHLDKPNRVFLTLFGIGLCTLLATFTKENGALLPVYLLVLEFTLLTLLRTHSPALWPIRVLRWSIILPSLLVVGYLLSLIPGLTGAYLPRPYNLVERLATETVILWDYLRLSFLPRLLELGPFHDDYPIYTFASPMVWAALIAWVVVIVSAILRRRAYPLLAFAVFWFLAGHLIESTLIPIELYFEHRNYLPILGPVIAFAALSTRIPIARRFRFALTGLYLAFMVFILWQTLSIWGNRQQEIWARQHPDSARAVQTVAQSYYEAGYRDEALRMLEDTWARKPQLSSLGMQALRLRCYQDDPVAFASLLNGLLNTLDKSYFSYLTMHALDRLQQLHASGNCSQIKAADLQALADALLANPRFNARGSIRQQLRLIKAHVFISQRELGAATEQLQKAFAAYPDQETMLLLHAILRDTDQDKAANVLLDQAVAKLPDNPWVRAQWLTVIDEVRGHAPATP